MTLAFAFAIALAALLLALAIWTIAVKDATSAVVGFVIYGLLLALVWVSLFAVDVALTEAAIGSGVTGMLLLGAAARLRRIEAAAMPPGLTIRIVAGFFCTLIAAGIAGVVLFPSGSPASLAPLAMESLAQSGLGNPVAGVLFVYRAFDTLLEKVVLLLALAGIWSLAPDRLWGGAPELRPYAQPNSILVFLAQLLPPVGIVFGIYMSWAGADYPGGAFQGGTVLAAMWLLVMMARLQHVPQIGGPWIRLLLVVGPATFLVIGLAGVVLADAFLAYPAGFAKPLIIVIEVALTISICITLGLLVAGPPEKARH